MSDVNTPKCWVVSDGTAGMLSQCVALLRILGHDGLELQARPTPILRLFPTLARLPGWPLTIGRKPDWLNPSICPELLITCGRRMAGISIGIKRLSGGRTRTIHIQDPHISTDYFDLLVIPSHDPIANNPPDNVIISTGALNRFSLLDIEEASKMLGEPYKRLNTPVTAVMIGGHSKHRRASRQDFIAFGSKLKQFARQHQTSLVLIASRRTPKLYLKTLCDHLGDRDFYLWDGQSPNPYLGILGLADTIIVTSDSVNMISEACITGKPVLITSLYEARPRIARFHEIMKAGHHIETLETILEEPKRLNHPFTPLDERAELAQKIIAFLATHP